MRVSKKIQNKMHRLAKLTEQASELAGEINNYFKDNGYDIDELRTGDGESLDELDYGNDVTDAFCTKMENGDFEYCRF